MAVVKKPDDVGTTMKVVHTMEYARLLTSLGDFMRTDVCTYNHPLPTSR
jgi:hypothetical protein